MSTELVTIQQPGALAQPPAQYVDLTGLDDFVKLKPGRFTLVQSGTREPGKALPGQFLNSFNGEVSDTITVVILKMMKGRVMYKPGADLDSGALCMSQDGLVPSNFSQQKQSPSCGSCYQSRWVTNIGSPCKENRTLLAVNVNDDLPYYIGYKGPSITLVQKDMEPLKLDIKSRWNNDGIALQSFHYAITFGSDFANTKKGKFFNWRIKNWELLPEDEMAKFSGFYSDFVQKTRVRSEFETAETQVEKAVSEVLEGEIVTEV